MREKGTLVSKQAGLEENANCPIRFERVSRANLTRVENIAQEMDDFNMRARPRNTAPFKI